MKFAKTLKFLSNFLDAGKRRNFSKFRVFNLTFIRKNRKKEKRLHRIFILTEFSISHLIFNLIFTEPPPLAEQLATSCPAGSAQYLAVLPGKIRDLQNFCNRVPEKIATPLRDTRATYLVMINDSGWSDACIRRRDLAFGIKRNYECWTRLSCDERNWSIPSGRYRRKDSPAAC